LREAFEDGDVLGAVVHEWVLRTGSEAEAPLKIVQLPYYFNPTSTKIINSQLTNLVWS